MTNQSIYLDSHELDKYLISEDSHGRYELQILSNGLLVVNFFNRHGSLFDVIEASEFTKERA